MPVRDDVRENPRIADQLLIADLSENGDREDDLRKSVEQSLVLNQRDPLIEQVLALKHAGFVDATIDPDH